MVSGTNFLLCDNTVTRKFVPDTIYCMDRRSPRPTDITLHQASGVLGGVFDGGRKLSMPVEYLRVYSPSAEVRGHGPGQEVLQVGKRNVAIKAIDPVGVYGVKLVFSDGHDTGIYSWDYLYDLG